MRGGGRQGGRVKDSMQIFKISHPRNQKMHFFFIIRKTILMRVHGWRRGPFVICCWKLPPKTTLQFPIHQ